MKVIIFSNLYQFLIFTLFFKILHFQLIYYEKVRQISLRLTNKTYMHNINYMFFLRNCITNLYYRDKII